jgi:excisionase family DNA binding protein
MKHLQASMQLPINEIAIAVAEQLTPLISQFKQTGNPPEDVYLTRKEAGIYIKLSLPTLHLYTQKGLLQAHKIGRRVLYKKSELDAAMKVLYTPIVAKW